MKHQRTFRWAVAFAIVSSVTLMPIGSARAVPFIKPNLPDFYQHQKAGNNANVPNDLDLKFDDAAAEPATVPSYDQAPNWWEDGGGWCCVAAHVNSFYFLEKEHGLTGFFTRAAAEAAFQAANGRLPMWQEQMIFAIEDLAKDMGFTSAPGLGGDAIPRHVRKLETGRHRVTYNEFELVGGKVHRFEADRAGDLPAAGVDESATFGTLFDAYHKELCRSEDVTFRLEFPGGAPKPPWWAPSFHVVTGAGVEDCTDPTKRTLYYADPDKRNRIVANAYVDEDVRERYPYDATLPVPVSPATNPTLHYEVATLDGSGCIVTDPHPYKGACIVKVTAISPVPVPGSGLLLTVAIAGLAVLRLCRPRAG